MLLIFAFIIGAHIGSFLNVCIWRLPRGESVVEPPSHCPKCDTRLKALDLVPLLSQICLRARCRYCGARIAWRYAGIELLTGVLFTLVALNQWTPDLDYSNPTLWVHLVQGWLMVSTLVVIFWIDYDTRLIQLEAVLLLGFTGLAADAWGLWRHEKTLADGISLTGTHYLPAPLPQSVVAMVFTASALWLIREVFSRIYQREAMGFGDVILVAAIAANLGWNATIVTFFFLSIMVGAAVGVTLQFPRAIRAYGWARRRSESGWTRKLAWPLARHAFRKAMPFGPMLALGAVVAMLYGQRVNDAYMKMVNPQYSFTSSGRGDGVYLVPDATGARP